MLRSQQPVAEISVPRWYSVNVRCSSQTPAKRGCRGVLVVVPLLENLDCRDIGMLNVTRRCVAAALWL